MTQYSGSPIGYTVHSGVATVTLQRAAASNALDVTMKLELLQALSAAHDDKSIRAVVITAAGKNFCVGQDLSEHIEALHHDPTTAMSSVREHYNPILRALHAIEVPVVVGINGACVGAGLGMALAADIRIAAEGAKFGTAFTGIALASDSALSASLPDVVGPSRARALFLLGETFGAAAAHQWGLVHQVVADAELAERTHALGARLASGPTAAFKEVKALLAANPGSALDDVLEREALAQARLGASVDHTASVEAFVRKQRPTFVGH